MALEFFSSLFILEHLLICSPPICNLYHQSSSQGYFVQFSDVSSGVPNYYPVTHSTHAHASCPPETPISSSGNTVEPQRTTTRLRRGASDAAAASSADRCFSLKHTFRQILSVVFHLLATQNWYTGLRHGLRDRENYVLHHRKCRDSR